jgi:AcrR family transcriptional regulator
MAARPSQLREKLKEATSQEILAAAEAELAERGLADAGMSGIAKRAGVSVGTLYNYFEDKERLLKTLLLDRRKRFHATLDAAVNAPFEGSFALRLETVVAKIFAYFEEHRDFLRIVLANERSLTSVATTQFVDKLRPLVAAGVAEGVLLDEDADLYAATLAGVIRAVMTERVGEPKRAFRPASSFVVRVFLHGAGKPA